VDGWVAENREARIAKEFSFFVAVWANGAWKGENGFTWDKFQFGKGELL